MLSKANATIPINKAFSYMYSAGYWLQTWKGKRVAKCIFNFLGSYQRLAYLTWSQGKSRYQFLPKLHYSHHFAVELDLQTSCPSVQWVENPLSTSVQIQEDYVGRPSRISRRVSIRKLHRNVVERTLILQCRALIQSDRDKRGMDGYGHGGGR